MDSRTENVDFEGLDQLLRALSQGVANRMQPTETIMAMTSLDVGRAQSVDAMTEVTVTDWREPAPVAARREPAPVSVEALPRGVPVEGVLRGALKHFLPVAAAVLVPFYPLFMLLNWFDLTVSFVWIPIVLSSTAGYSLGLLAISRWLYPHSNPDGQRSDMAALASSIVAMFTVAAVGEERAWIVGLSSGLIAALVAFAPWLRHTSRIAPASLNSRWAKLHAAVGTGALGAVVFGSLSTVRFGSMRLVGSPSRFAEMPFVPNVMWDVTVGFLIGGAFAIAIGVVYRRRAMEDLKAWKVGLWGAAASLLPSLVFSMAMGAPLFPGPLSSFLPVAFTNRLLPGFLMAYIMVKLAQRSGGRG